MGRISIRVFKLIDRQSGQENMATIMGRISIRVFKLIDRQSGQENIAIVER